MDISTSNEEFEVCDIPILVLYGSQTGTAEETAERIVVQSRGSVFKSKYMAMDDYSIESLVHEKLIIFVCSTTGQGEPPDNMKRFWRFIMRKNLPSSSLADVSYAVLGLGDSSYAKYNFVAKKLYRRLQNLGGQPILKLGLADDQHDWGPDAEVDRWTTEMWKTLADLYPHTKKYNNPLDNTLPPPKYRVTFCDSELDGVIDLNNIGMQNGTVNNGQNPYLARVKDNIRVTSEEHWQETRLLKLDISDACPEMSYKPGDVVMVMPSNLSQDVKEFLGILPFDGDAAVRIDVIIDEDAPIKLPRVATLRELSTRYFDFMSVPRRSFFQLLYHFATDENEKDKLKEFGSPEGTEERYSYANRPRRTILEILQDFHLTAKLIPLVRIFELIPFIRPRAFSIASSPSCHKGEIHILVTVVRYKTRLSKPRKGLCSSWMTTLKPGMRAPVWLKRGGIRFPHGRPCIMVGPGTGIAPFRSAAHERCLDETNETVIFFGCRNREKDFYFEDEWKSLPVKFIPAFSRDQDDKVYVQHKISENAYCLWELLHKKNACVFVAGNSKNMPNDVKAAFLDLFRCHGNMTTEEADEYFNALQQTKRYQQETWS